MNTKIQHFFFAASIFLASSISSQLHAGKQQKTHSDRFALSETEHIEKVMQFSGGASSTENQLRVFNVYGSIDVQGYSGDEVQITATNQVSANSDEKLQIGLAEIGLKFQQTDHRITVYLDSPYTYIDEESGKIWHSDTCKRHDDCSEHHEKRNWYSYMVDITVKMPENTSLKLSTINGGEINVKGVDAKSLSVSNVNGPIKMIDVAGTTQANTINQNIDISYRKNPSQDSSYTSINGDVNINFKDEPDAEVSYETMNGEIYTAYDVQHMAPKVHTTTKQNKHGTRYKVNAGNRFQLGIGGSHYKFKTLNGDIKLQRNSD